VDAEGLKNENVPPSVGTGWNHGRAKTQAQPKKTQAA